jgi:glycine hydroxymethyltransferase
MNRDRLELVDPFIAAALRAECDRQQHSLNLIASENIPSAAVREALASPLLGKYAEGYPGRRFYGGCDVIDRIEQVAIDRAKNLFSMPHANVQPHSGTNANMAVFRAILKPGDTILGPDLAHGGHITAGAPANYSGQMYSVVHYHVRAETELIDLDEVRRLARDYRPTAIIAGGSAFPRVIDFAAFHDIADEVGARLIADIAHPAGLITAGLHVSPAGLADFITTSTQETLRGPAGGLVLCGGGDAAAVDRAVMPGVQSGPHMHVVAAKAVAFVEAATPQWRIYQQRVLENARALATALLARGHRLVTGGTDTHLILVDLSAYEMTGKEGQEALDSAGITVNKNPLPFDRRDHRGLLEISGIRLGTPAITSRGLGVAEMVGIADLISRVIGSRGAPGVIASVRNDVADLAARFPLGWEDFTLPCTTLAAEEALRVSSSRNVV